MLLPALLVGLVGVLAALQYRWLGKVSEAEREQLSRSLAERARGLTDALDRELTGLYRAAYDARDAALARDGAVFGQALGRWRSSARYPGMIRGVYLAEWNAGQLTCLRYDGQAAAFDAAPLSQWPAHLEPVRAHLTALGPPPRTDAVATAATVGPAIPAGTTVRVVTLARTPVVDDVPALVVALSAPLPEVTLTRAVDRDAGAPTTLPAGIPRPHVSLVIDLDRDYLTGTVLPDLADAHFPPGDADYRLTAVTGGGTTVFRRGVAADATIDPRQADVVVPFFGIRIEWFADSFRVEGGQAGGGAASSVFPRPDSLTVIQRQGTEGSVAVRASGGTPPSGETAPGRMPVAMSFNIATQARSADGQPIRQALFEARRGWRLFIQHGAGSLDAAVSQARLRNLWLSFGILGVLAAGIVLVMANARRSQQLAAKQMDFVATVSHELRTPLAVIRSAAQNLSAGVVADPAQARRYGTLIEDEGRRLTDMVEQVMDYAGLEGRSRVRAPRPVDVVALVEEAAVACRPVCDAAGCALVVDTSAGESDPVPAVMGDEGALGRVVANLITNAAKHGADGQWIGVTVSSCALKHGREVLIAVRDRGRGIDAADLAHVFEPFRRGARAVERQIHGNGLGLSLVKRIVEAHGGRVAVSSTPGEGATFVVYLPAMPEAGEPGSSR